MFRISLGCILIKEMLSVLLELLLGSLLVIESLHIFETSERVPRDRVESVIDHVFETGWEHATHEEVIVRVDRHLLLVLPEVLHRISRPGATLKARHYELFEEAER